MDSPPAVAIRPGERWGEVAVDLGLAAAGVLLVAVATPELDGTRPVGLWLVVVYTCWAVAVTVVLAVLAAATRRHPTLAPATLDGAPATVLHSARAPWCHAVALDAGLGVLGLALAVAGVRAGGDWALVGLVPGVGGLWFAGRIALVVLGRRRRPALWLTDTELVVDSPTGRLRAARADVVAARGRGRRLVVSLARDADGSVAPWPWRPSSSARDILVLDCSDTGHRAGDLADWLDAQVVVRPGREGASRLATRRTGRRA